MTEPSLSNWSGCPLPDGRPLAGRTVRLERLDAERHGAALGAALSGPNVAGLYDYLGDPPAQSADEVIAWAKRVEGRPDPFFYAIIDQASGQAVGRLALMRIDAANGAIEVGHVLYGPSLARSMAASEAQFLLMRHIFDDLGYRRYEWKCNALNALSQAAARRMGFIFEGVFHQHTVVKHKNRDTAWFSMTDIEWPARKDAFTSWLGEGNFDAHAQQKSSLGVLIAHATTPAKDQSVLKRLRRVEAQEADAFATLQYAAYVGNREIIGREPTPLVWDYDEIVRTLECWVIEGTAGFEAGLVLQSRPGDLYAESIAVTPRMQGRGLGGTLLRFAERRAASHASGLLRLLTNEALMRNVDWYLGRGLMIETVERRKDRTLFHFVKTAGGIGDGR